MAVFLLILVSGLAFRTQANRQCTSCIPLEDLLSEAYGIEVTLDGLSSAVAFHNGTMRHISSSLGSSDYRSRMQSIVDMYMGLPPQRKTSKCLSRQQPLALSTSSYAQIFFNYLTIVLFQLGISSRRHSLQRPPAEESPAPVDPNVQLFQKEMEALSPFANMSSYQRSKASVSISVPGWLTGTDEVCQIAEAAAVTVGRSFLIENHPSVSYTALGYELCRIDYEYFDCTGPGRITTLDFQPNSLVTISQIRTPLSYWATQPVTFAVSRNLAHQEMTEWIDSFVISQQPDMVMVTGPDSNKPHIQRAVQRSQAWSLIINQTAIESEKAAALGAAQAAKDNLERQVDDCGEPAECYAIRREANRIAGGFNPPKPSTWPAFKLRRFRDEL